MARPTTAEIRAHPQNDLLREMWHAGAKPREMAAAIGKPSWAPYLSLYSRREWGTRSTTTTETTYLDPDASLDEQLDAAKEALELARSKGLTPKDLTIRINEAKGATTTNEGWQRLGQGEDAVTAPQTWNKDASRKEVVLKVDTKKDNQVIRIEQARPLNVTLRFGKRPPALLKHANERVAVVLPDAQRPFEDHAALDVAYQVLERVEALRGVDLIVHVGDDLDLPEFGSFVKSKETMTTSPFQQSINSQYQGLSCERAICPSARMVWLAGNHEARLTKWLHEKALELVGIHRPGEEAGHPVISVPYLCRLDELEVEYLDPYPEAEFWFNDHLRAIHGTTAKNAKGATAAEYLTEGNISTIYGHIHRFELVAQTRHTRSGPRTYWAGSPGCLCRIDGAVPSTKSGITAKGKQGMSVSEDWQQGLFVITYETKGRQLFNIEPAHIWDGETRFWGERFVSSVMPDGSPRRAKRAA